MISGAAKTIAATRTHSLVECNESFALHSRYAMRAMRRL
jgi:hypothetical protein